MRRGNRKFGIELEFDCSWDKLKGEAKHAIKKIYGRRKYYSKEESFSSDIYTDKWHIKIDYSDVSELTTPISTLDDMDNICKVITYLRDSGIGVNDSCGFHVHIDIKDIDQYKFMAAWLRSEKAIIQCFPKSRRDSYHCERILDKTTVKKYIASLLVSKTYEAGHGNSISLDNYEDRKTVEVRIAEGTNDPNFIKNWVLFLLYWMDSVKKMNPCLLTCDKCNVLKFNQLLEEMNINNNEVVSFMKKRYNKFKNIKYW